MDLKRKPIKHVITKHREQSATASGRHNEKTTQAASTLSDEPKAKTLDERLAYLEGCLPKARLWAHDTIEPKLTALDQDIRATVTSIAVVYNLLSAIAGLIENVTGAAGSSRRR